MKTNETHIGTNIFSINVSCWKFFKNSRRKSYVLSGMSLQTYGAMKPKKLLGFTRLMWNAVLSLLGLCKDFLFVKLTYTLLSRLNSRSSLILIFFFFIFFLAVYLVHRFKLFRSSKKTLKLSIVQLIQVIKDKNPRKLAVTAANLKIDLLLNKA